MVRVTFIPFSHHYETLGNTTKPKTGIKEWCFFLVFVWNKSGTLVVGHRSPVAHWRLRRRLRRWPMNSVRRESIAAYLIWFVLRTGALQLLVVMDRSLTKRKT